MANIRLKKKLIFSGTIKLITGLHIGGSNAALNIGGPDKFVVRNPLNNVPYIPGSSLKGKMRSLIELFYGESQDGEPSTDVASHAGALFGVASDSKTSRPSRLIVRDAELCTDKGNFSNTDMPYTESKTEVSINRITSVPNPRTFERVPAGAEFNVSMVLNIFENEDEKSLRQTLEKAVQLLEDDYLGGQGSRGYGQVKFNIDFSKPDEKNYM